MKQILTALFVITASVATAEGEGRYITATISNDPITIIVTDTKLGKVRLCNFIGWHLYYDPLIATCDKWRDVQD